MSDPNAVAVIFASVHHGNTRLLAETLAAELSADLFPWNDVQNRSLDHYDMIGMGSGIYFGRHHVSLRRMVESWSYLSQKVFIYSTAGLPFLRWCQHGSLRRRLVRKGRIVVGEFSCRGWDTVGPLWLMGGINRKHPGVNDLQRARDFAAGLKLGRK
jgi:flavodoxin